MINKILITAFLLVFISLFGKSIYADDISKYDHILKKVRAGNETILRDIDYQTLEDITEAYRMTAENAKVSFIRLFLLGKEEMFSKVDKMDDEVDQDVRLKISKSVANGLVNTDPRVRLACIHMLYKIGMDEEYVTKKAEESAKKETVDLFYDYTDIYGRIRTKSIRKELLKLIEHDSLVPLLEPVPTSEPYRFMYGSEHSLVTYDQTFTFEWGHVLGAYEYQVYLDDELVYIGRDTICNYQRELSYGTHSWYVLAKIKGQDFVKSRINVIHIRKLTSPKLIVKQSSMTDSKPRFSWDSVRGAMTYELYIYGRGLLYKVMIPHGKEVIQKYQREQWDYSEAEYLPPSKQSDEEKEAKLKKLENDKKQISQDKRQDELKYTTFLPNANLADGNYLCYLIAKNGFQNSRSEAVAFIIYNKKDKGINFSLSESKVLPPKEEKIEEEGFDKDSVTDPESSTDEDNTTGDEDNLDSSKQLDDLIKDDTDSSEKDKKTEKTKKKTKSKKNKEEDSKDTETKSE